MISRRDFLAQTAGLGALAVGGSTPWLWQRAAAAAEAQSGLPILIVIELSGGNDGLNTVVPHGDDAYARARPTLKVDPKKVLKLDDRMGLHPAMTGFKELFDAGDLVVVQGVGYPNPNRSHFRSMEIWHTGATGPAPPAGWLGRLADAEPGFTAWYVGGEAIPLAVRARKQEAQALTDLSQFRLRSGANFSESHAGEPDGLTREIQQRMEATRRQAERVEQFLRSHVAAEPDSLQGRLETIRSLIELDPKIRVFYTDLGGFDTHANQLFTHDRLLRTLSSAVAGFITDLRSRRLNERVAILIFSEFGRRIEENGQRGTDHGAAGPVFLAGTPVKGGLVGPAPELSDIDHRGDLKHTADFRDLYASVLKHWLHVDPMPIVGDRRSDLILF